jgi:hypothetical protein
MINELNPKFFISPCATPAPVCNCVTSTSTVISHSSSGWIGCSTSIRLDSSCNGLIRACLFQWRSHILTNGKSWNQLNTSLERIAICGWKITIRVNAATCLWLLSTFFTVASSYSCQQRRRPWIPLLETLSLSLMPNMYRSAQFLPRPSRNISRSYWECSFEDDY